MINRETTHKLARFLTVGGCAGAVDFSGLWLLSHWLTPLAAFSGAYAVGITTHFLLNKYWTFRCARADIIKQVGEYLFVAVLCYGIQNLAFRLGLRAFHHNIYLAKMSAIPPSTLAGFFLFKARVFKGGERQSARS